LWAFTSVKAFDALRGAGYSLLVRRNILLLPILAALLALTWLQSPVPKGSPEFSFAIEPLPLPPRPVAQAHLGPFLLSGAWELRSDSERFGGYSSLVPMPDGQLLMFSDGGRWLQFSPPGADVLPPDQGNLMRERGRAKETRDVEAATRDPVSGAIWLGLESTNTIARLNRRLGTRGTVDPPSLSRWGVNSGPESMAKLQDGRFVLLREAFVGWLQEFRHDAVVFPGDPVAMPLSGRHFRMDGPRHFKPTDMAQLPDGRILVLMRRLVWPMPQRFAGRIAIGDPALLEPGRAWHLTEVARIPSTLPVDNFEGMAVVPGPGRKVTVWLISDDNYSNFQRTVLWRLEVDPSDLPG